MSVLDPDAIEARANAAAAQWSLVELHEIAFRDVPALIAGVRELESMLAMKFMSETEAMEMGAHSAMRGERQRCLDAVSHVQARLVPADRMMRQWQMETCMEIRREIETG